MDIKVNGIDGGKPFDWGKTSQEYARYRDIYPEEFYRRIIDRGLCTAGQSVLDIGTGTGVLPRNMYRFGARWVGTDISPEQIAGAKQLAQRSGMDITFLACGAEQLDFPAESFDVVTACQCIWYFDHKVLAPKLAAMLKKGGRMLILYMAWLPFEDKIAGGSEKLVLKYNPEWTGAGETRHDVFLPEELLEYFTLEHKELYDVPVHFTRESWHGRMKACRGVGASMTPAQIENWEREHIAFLESEAPAEFNVLHYVSTAELKLK